MKNCRSSKIVLSDKSNILKVLYALRIIFFVNTLQIVLARADFRWQWQQQSTIESPLAIQALEYNWDDDSNWSEHFCEYFLSWQHSWTTHQILLLDSGMLPIVQRLLIFKTRYSEFDTQVQPWGLGLDLSMSLCIKHRCPKGDNEAPSLVNKALTSTFLPSR